MKLMLCSIKDIAVGAYMPPFSSRAPGEALRLFREALLDPQAPGAKHPSDLDLYHIANYDDQTGQVFQLERIELLVTGRSLAEQDPPQR